MLEYNVKFVGAKTIFQYTESNVENSTGESANSETAILGQEELRAQFDSTRLFTPSGMAPRFG